MIRRNVCLSFFPKMIKRSITYSVIQVPFSESEGHVYSLLIPAYQIQLSQPATPCSISASDMGLLTKSQI